MTPSSCPPNSPSGPDATADERLALSAAEAAFLAAAHPELLHALQQCPTPAEPVLEVRALPMPTQRFIWKLYERHYPELASWIRELNMEAWREQFGATLGLSPADILAAVRREADGASDPRQS